MTDADLQRHDARENAEIHRVRREHALSPEGLLELLAGGVGLTAAGWALWWVVATAWAGWRWALGW